MVKVNSFWIYFYRLSVKAYRLRYKVRIYWELGFALRSLSEGGELGRGPQHCNPIAIGCSGAEDRSIAPACRQAGMQRSWAGGCLLTAEARYVIAELRGVKLFVLAPWREKNKNFSLRHKYAKPNSY